MVKADICIKSVLVSIISLLWTTHISAVDKSDADSLKNVAFQIINRNHGVVNGIPVFSSNTSCAPSVTDESGHAVLSGISDSDTLYALLSGSLMAKIKADGIDSVLITIKSKGKYRVKSLKRTMKTTPVDVIDNVPEILKKGNITSLVELLRGLVSGLSITRSPEGGYETNIRGIKSINGSSEPIVLLDGVEIGTLSDANQTVDVYDIQSIEVDKDGSMYGVRGANGVIKIHSIGHKQYAY